MTIEAATSARAKCRACKKPIAKGELRFGEDVPGNFDGVMTFWYHLTCAASQRPEQLGPELADYKKPIPDRAALAASLEGAVASTRTAKLLRVDRAPTSRAKCQQCKQRIEKTTLRVAVLLDQDPTLPGTGFLHLVCAPVYAGTDVDVYLAGKTAKPDRVETAAVLKAQKLLDTVARGKDLELSTRKAKKKDAEISVLSDWLEEQGCALQSVELTQLLNVRAKR